MTAPTGLSNPPLTLNNPELGNISKYCKAEYKIIAADMIMAGWETSVNDMLIWYLDFLRK